MKRKRKPGRSAEAESCAPKAGCAKFAIYDKIVAVYDKKMLWRANLYIDKKEESLGGVDWNNAHPWVVPASSVIEGPKWWDAELWGYNEWSNLGGEVCR